MTDDTPTTPENSQNDQIDARDSIAFVNRPTAPVTQHFGPVINIGKLHIPIYLVLIISICLISIWGAVTYPVVKSWLPTPRAFATQSDGETLIVIATFHNTAATNSEAHTKIRRAITTEAATHNEQQLRIEVEPTELTADQRTEAEALGKRYNASMIIWGEDTGVEVIVNFLNLREPDFVAASVTITEAERTQLANPSAYARFITNDLPKTMNFFAFFAIGQSYFFNTQYALAIERIEAAVALVPPDVKPEGLVEAYFRLGWLYQVQLKKLDEAIADYNKAIELKPDYVAAYTNLGSARYSLGKLDEAIADYNKAIELKPDYAYAYNNRGISRYRQGKLDEAIADYNKAIEFKPDYADAYNNRGLALYDQGKLYEAIADYNKAIEFEPDYVAAYTNLGNARYKLGKLDEAIADYNKAIELKPDYVAAYTNLGNARYSLGKLDEAIADYNKAIELKPDYAYAYNNRGISRYRQGGLDEAIADYNKAIEFKPDYADAYNNRGLALYDQGKLKEALADYQHYLELQPNAPDRSQVEQWIAKIEAEIAKQK